MWIPGRAALGSGVGGNPEEEPMPTRTTRSILIALVAALALLLAACGDDGDDSSTAVDADDATSTDTDGDDAGDDGMDTDGDDAGDEGLEESIDGMVDDLEDLQDSQGGGSATLRIGEQEWTFAPVLCAFGEEQIGQEGAEFVLSSIQDGAQMYATIDSFGHSVSLDDVENFEDPSVGYSSFGDFTLTVDGKNASGEGEFMDTTTDSFETVAGSFTATCP